MSLTFSQFLKEQFYNEQLHPRFYNDDKEFDPEVRKKLLDIAWDFADKTETTEHIQDIQLTGSMANYNYTKYSDLDVHLLLDFKDINKDEDLVKKALDGSRFVWNQRHDIIIREHEIELYFQDVDEPHAASGLYSLLDDQWLREPKYDPPEVDERDVLKKAEQYERDIDILYDKLSEAISTSQAEQLHQAGDKLREKIHKMRKDSLVREGEFGIGNLAFKHLRNTRAIEKLIDATTGAYDKIYNELNEISFETYSKEMY